MSITLQSTVGGFSAEFMRRLPALELAMIAHGLEPSQFVISKDRATPPSVPFIGPFFYAYTVFVGDDSFTVTEPNDIIFLEYFYDRCIAEDEPTPEQQQAQRSRPGPDQAHLPLDGAADLSNGRHSGARVKLANPESRGCMREIPGSRSRAPRNDKITPPTALPGSRARSLRNSGRP
jgi:hypothetical protein